MKYTLLKTVQLILSAMDSDEVNDIGDTTESLQIVDILETTFNDIASTVDLTENWDFFNLELISASQPSMMKLPDTIAKMDYVQYSIADNPEETNEWRTVTPLPRSEFFAKQEKLNIDDANVETFTWTNNHGTTVRYYTLNDRHPSYYTTIDDNTLLFDSYSVDDGSSLIASRTRAYGMFIPTFERSNTWVAPLEPRQFTLYFNEAKSQAFAELKQVPNQKAEQRARRGWVQSQRKQPALPPGEILESYTPNFGRRRSRR